MFDLKNKTAVVTGGGGVLCGCMALELASRGAGVAVLDLRKDAAQAVADQIAKAGGHAVGIACDVLDKAGLQAARDAVLAEFGGIDILINGAGGNSPKATTSHETCRIEDLQEDAHGSTVVSGNPFPETSSNFDVSAFQCRNPMSFFDLDPDAVEFVFRLNFLGTLLPSQVFGRVMAGQRSGVIVNISSMNAFKPLTKIPAYSAAKAAISNFTQWLAAHFAPVNVRVNAIAPGFFLTEQNRFLLTDEKTGELTERGNAIIAHTPLGRFGQPEDLNGTLVWLVSDASRFVTGVVVPVDGGFSAFGGV